MLFRLKACGLHLLGSAAALSLVWGILYLGWYHWPGWYLDDVLSVVGVMAGIDLALGPTLTLIIANAAKSRRELTRDIGVIVIVQLVALVYGGTALWGGRPLYYTFSMDRLEMVRASDLDPDQIAQARAKNPTFAPYWYSTIRWVWAPFPDDKKTADSILQSAISGGSDIIDMPQYFKRWEAGLPELRKQLKTVAKLSNLSFKDVERVKTRMSQRGFAPDRPIAMIMTGRGAPLVAVIDPSSARIQALIRSN
jgi:hypothetical protein